MYHHLFNLICFQYRILDIPYFLDECQLYEINDILEYIPCTDRNLWESQRMNAFITAKANFKNIKSFDDICKFKWNEDTEEEHNYEISNEDIQRLKKLSKKWGKPYMKRETSKQHHKKS